MPALNRCGVETSLNGAEQAGNGTISQESAKVGIAAAQLSFQLVKRLQLFLRHPVLDQLAVEDNTGKGSQARR